MTHFLQRTSLIALMAGALGACTTTSDALRPSYPIYPTQAPPAQTPPAGGSTAPVQSSPAPVPAEEAPVTAAPAAPVQSSSLSPLGAAQPASPPPAAATPAPAASRPRQAPPAQPTYRTVTSRSVTGKVVDVDGPPETYEVKKGDTLDKIAKKMGTTVAQLREDNDLGKKGLIHPGQELKGPTSSAKAYTVGQGDTLFAIARRFGVSADDIAAENNLTRARALRTGQKLRLPAGYKDKGPITTTTRVLVEGGAPVSRDDDADVAEALAPAPARPARTPAPNRTTPTRTADSETVPSTPSYRTTTKRSVTGRVIDVEGPPVSYTVRKGDTLEEIADKLGTSVADLKKDNKLKRSTIHPGDRLKGPASEAKAYVAVSGDTLSLIARRFGVTESALRSQNGLSSRAAIKPGQKIRLPDRYRDRGAIVETIRTPVAEPDDAGQSLPPTPVQTPRPAPQPSTPAPLPTRPQPYTPPAQTTSRPYTPPPASSTPASAPPVAPTATPAPGDLQISELGRGRFVWPLQGQIVSDFGPKGGGQRNDGLNIGASAGAPVRAAAAGDVVYAGDQVPGFGNLVLIKHADGWVTAYGHLARVDVKMQQKVTQGQQIGQAGMSGGVSEPQLHFEIRYAPSPMERAKPIDPKLVLPR